MISDDQWIVARRELNRCTVYTTLWHVGEMYGQIEHFESPFRIVSYIKMPVPKMPSKVSLIDWTMHGTVDEAKEWCIAQLTKHRLMT